MHGVFFTADDIAKRNPTRVSNVFAALPGVSVSQFAPNRYLLLGRQLVRSNTGAMTLCLMSISVEGNRIGSLATRSLLDRKPGANVARVSDLIEQNGESYEFDALVQPADVVGIEYYENPGDAPAAYQGLNGGCGIVLIWTKHGNEKSP